MLTQRGGCGKHIIIKKKPRPVDGTGTGPEKTSVRRQRTKAKNRRLSALTSASRLPLISR